MANRLEELTGSQRKVTEELRRLTSQLRQGQNRATPAGRDGTERLVAGLVQIARIDQPGSPVTDVSDENAVSRLSATTSALTELSRGVEANTSALRQNSTIAGRLAAGLGGGLTSDLSGGGISSLLKSGLGLAPIGTAITSLFRGKEREEPTFSAYDPPAPRQLEVANANTLQTGLPETVRGDRGNVREATVNQPANVVVNVSAMDSRSFMDRSSEIASAVREAMLHMHPVNDVVSEL